MAPRTKPTPRKGWRGRQVRRRRTETLVLSDCPPMMEIDIYPNTIVQRIRQEQTWCSRLVSPQALVAACAQIPQTSGLLVPQMLGMGWVAGGTPYYVQYLPPGLRRLMTHDRTYTIPIPPLVIGGCGADYVLWALDVTAYPTTADLPLWVAPFPNCERDGQICWGSAQPVTPATAHTLTGAARLFLEESVFNAHTANRKSLAYPVSVIAHWQDVERRQLSAYPRADLLPAERSLGWLLAGGPWGEVY